MVDLVTILINWVSKPATITKTLHISSLKHYGYIQTKKYHSESTNLYTIIQISSLINSQATLQSPGSENVITLYTTIAYELIHRAL